MVAHYVLRIIAVAYPFILASSLLAGFGAVRHCCCCGGCRWRGRPCGRGSTARAAVNKSNNNPTKPKGE